MQDRPPASVEPRWPALLAPTLGVAVMALGGWVLGEWLTGSLHVARLEDRFLTVAPSTALGFVLVGGLILGERRRRQEGASFGWAGVLVGLALVSLWALVYRPSTLLPPGLFPVHAPSGWPRFGFMSPWAGGFFLMALGAEVLRFREGASPTWRLSLAQGLSAAGLVGSGLLLAGFGFKSPLLQEGKLLPIAAPAALAFNLIAIAQLTAGEPSWGMRWLRSPTLFARLTRKTIPAMLTLVVLGGWFTGAVLIRYEGEGRLLAAALVTVVTAALMGLLTGAVAVGIQREVDQGQKALRDREENLRTILNSIGDGVISTDLRGGVTGMNPVAESLTGWTVEEAKGRPHGEVVRLLEPGGRLELPDLTERVLREGRPFATLNPSLLVARDGAELRVFENAAPIRDEEGTVKGMVIALRDMTQYVELEDKLRQAQKMDAIGQLSGGVAHDFNNMLTGIQGGAEMLALRLSQDPELSRYVAMIKDGALRATDLTAKLLAFARKGKVISTGVDIHEVIRATLLLLERSIDPRIHLTARLEADHPYVVGDPTMLQNVLLNLGINARDALPEGGSLVFATADARVDEGQADKPPFRLEPGPYLEITVTDTGTGIPAAILEKVFEPFFTTKPVGHGTGLGLAAVYGAMKEHRGAVTVTSEVGRGTCFRLLLPTASVPTPSTSPREAEAPRGEGRVLVIEDEPLVRSVAMSLLESLGLTVLLAEDGLAGVEVFERERHRIDLVLLDMVMPRLGGKETLLRLREIQPDVKVLLCSGFDLEGHLGELMRIGANGFIQKPYRRSALGEAIAKVRAS